MSKILVLGAGVCGLAAAVMLRRDGHEVTVLERDAEPPPDRLDDAWERWARDGVTQFRQAHFLQSRARLVLEEALPDVAAELAAEGALRFHVLGSVPGIELREDDERFATLTARRPVLERVLARAADHEPGLDVRRGVGVRELVAKRLNGVPHVSGARTESGKELGADLVVDATGRRSQLPRWLAAAGSAPVHEQAEDSGFIYYTRYFRGALPEVRAPLLMPIGTFSVLTLPADNGTWSVTLYISAGDRPLKRLREPAAWTALLAACPLHAHWLEGEPISGVEAMGGVVDRYRRFVAGGEPVATGIAAVGDSWACSNPSLGRGIALGLLHSKLLRDAVRDHLEDPRGFAEAWDGATETELAPWYWETVDEDRARVAEIDSLRNGTEPPAARSELTALRQALLAAAARDLDAVRAFIATRCCVTPLSETFADREFVERILELARGAEPRPLAGPDRAKLLELLDESVTAA